MSLPSLRPFLRWSCLFVPALVACTGPSTVLDDETRVSVEAEVREAVISLMEAMNAHDGDAVLAHYEESSELTYLGVTRPRIGWESFARAVGPWYASHDDVTFEYEILRVRALAPDAAFVVMRGRSTEAEALAWTQILTKGEDGRWRIVHEHEAWPGAGNPPPPHPM